MFSDFDLSSRRWRVAVLAVCCLGGSAILLAFPGHDALRGALLRVGMLLSAFWLAMPTKNRPAAWKIVNSNWVLVLGVILSIALPRARAAFPILAAIFAIAWFAKPKAK